MPYRSPTFSKRINPVIPFANWVSLHDFVAKFIRFMLGALVVTAGLGKALRADILCVDDSPIFNLLRG